MMPLAQFFFFKIALALRGLLWFHTNCRVVLCSVSVKNAVRILIRIVFDLKIALGSMDILTILIFVILSMKYLSIFVSFSISFLELFNDSVKCFSRHFIPSDVILNGILFLICF